MIPLFSADVDIELPCLKDYSCSVCLESWSLSSLYSVNSALTIWESSETSWLVAVVGCVGCERTDIGMGCYSYWSYCAMRPYKDSSYSSITGCCFTGLKAFWGSYFIGEFPTGPPFTPKAALFWPKEAVVFGFWSSGGCMWPPKVLFSGPIAPLPITLT